MSEEFIYRIARKRTCWETELIKIEADTKEEADLLAVQSMMFEREYDVMDYETNDYGDQLSLQDNGRYATAELYDESRNTIADNTLTNYAKFEEAVAEKKKLDNIPKVEFEW